MAEPCGAEVLVRNLKAQGVTHVFGVPGAKVDRVFDALLDSGIDPMLQGAVDQAAEKGGFHRTIRLSRSTSRSLNRGVPI
jgi:hypothetical protein